MRGSARIRPGASRENERAKRDSVKATRLHGRGGPEQLFFEDASAPEVRAGDVLVRVFATGITPAELTWDETYQHADGTPRIPSIPGHEISGVVERVAPVADDFRPGDEVYGLADFPRDGAAAEVVAVRAVNLARKPQSIAHTQAASLPLSALTAWQALFEHGDLVAGQSVLIHGGAGGVGSLAVSKEVDPAAGMTLNVRIVCLSSLAARGSAAERPPDTSFRPSR